MAKLDDYDYDAQYIKNHPVKVGFHLGFKVMALMIDRLVDEVGEVTDKYPKSELMKIWGCDMGVFFFVFLISYKVIILAALPFYFFYGFVLIKLLKAWKKFKYNMLHIILLTVGTMVLEFIVTSFIRSLFIP